MRHVTDLAALAAISDVALRKLLERRVADLAHDSGCDAFELATFIVVEPSDRLAAIEALLGFPVTANRHNGIHFGAPGFSPSFELIEDHGNYYEIVFVLSDDGYGAEVFVAKQSGVDARLLAMCAAHALSHPAGST